MAARGLCNGLRLQFWDSMQSIQVGYGRKAPLLEHTPYTIPVRPHVHLTHPNRHGCIRLHRCSSMPFLTAQSCVTHSLTQKLTLSPNHQNSHMTNVARHSTPITLCKFPITLFLPPDFTVALGEACVDVVVETVPSALVDVAVAKPGVGVSLLESPKKVELAASLLESSKKVELAKSLLE